jgi:hypothetical protein
LILSDLAQVVYAPSKAFKKIIENPKYLAAILVLVLFVALSIGFEFVQFSKVYTENTVPQVGDQQDFLNATVWNSASNVALSNNFADPFNYSIYVAAIGGDYSVFGNSSLEMDATHTNNITATISNQFNVDCSTSSDFQNLSMTIKQVAPSSTPQTAALTLYSLNDSSYYTYDLTSALNTATTGVWNNLTVPLGPKAAGWTLTGTPSWGNITSLQLSLTYPADSNITLRIGALFFRGQYQSPAQSDTIGLLEQFLSSYGFQFILLWFILTGVIYLFYYGLKTTHVWKPLFVATGCALIVMAIRALVELIAAAALPTLYYPYDVALGVRFNFFGATVYAGTASNLTTQSQAILSSINASLGGFETLLLALFAIAYIWLGVLSTIIIGTSKPEFSMTKRIIIAAVAVAVTIFLSLLLVGLV